MKCPECNGLLFVRKIEGITEEKRKTLNYDRLCDVECVKCKKVIYSQPYDPGSNINIVKEL